VRGSCARAYVQGKLYFHPRAPAFGPLLAHLEGERDEVLPLDCGVGARHGHNLQEGEGGKGGVRVSSLMTTYH
jgi:hypothetical protein